ncbi:1, 4-beta cellobiohydrolase [Phytophthora cactorum]|nr:1, 4-beta cellobiohydrolase [Phytophthora cactorum]
MLGNILRSRLVTAAVSCVALALSSVAAEELCSVVPYSYTVAKSTYPELSTALGTLENYAIASWFTDRSSTEERAGLLSRMLSQCPESSRLSIVVYGIPQKDCAGGFSTSGSVTDTNSYKIFLKQLTDTIGDRKVLYVVEPDAVGLLTQDNGCGASAGYLENLKVAVSALSVNPNAELYLDVATAMKDIGASGRVKGITINTSNYRSNDECARYCTNFQNAMGSTAMSCIVDTSRNYNGSPTNDWCNIPTAGIGRPPTSNTGYSNLDYFMWIKPPGESDGYCWGGQTAGSFFYGGFKLLWDQGYFVKELGMPKIGETSGTVTVTSAPLTSAPTSAPTVAPTSAPSTVAPTAPVTATPSPVWYTTAPETFAPGTTAPWSYAPSPCRVRKRLRSL